ncbi:MAG: efflux RND transporter periplasmic adaptor subunit [Pyrinomonadaceae bacterium]|nr:efflux RND transporter periplasmic adaptor subunit [Sphingobacteriaceae bacterium]
MKRLIFYLLLMFPVLALAHGGEHHGESKTAAPMASTYFTSVANSEKYELLLKYEPIKGGQEAIMRLYVSDFKTNKAIDDAKLEITSTEDDKLKFTVKHLEAGIYELSGKFPANKAYSLIVSINSANGADLMVLENVEVGKVFPVAETAPEETLFSRSNILLLLGGIGLGALIVLIILGIRNRKIQPKYAATVLLLLSLPISTTKISAHGGEDHSKDASAKEAPASGASDTFLVPKESQYLFEILTAIISKEDFLGSNDFLGTVIPSTTGMAVIQSPQTGKIVSLRTAVGQSVSKGQVLAVIEQSIDAGTQVDLLTQRNNAEAEYNAAKVQYERLKTIADIAAKKDVQEAEARFKSAESNRRLLRQLGSSGNGNSKLVSLTSPISGVVGSFNFAIGAVVNTGETLFSVTNLSKVYIEAQIYSKDVQVLKNAKEILAASSTDSSVKGKLKLISTAQSVNDANQTQKYIFELSDAEGDFKIGQNITVRVLSGQATSQLVVPNSAITEINGKPAVFVKDSPESYTVSYILKGTDNGTQTSILKGIKDGDRVVNMGTYQMKTMFLNQ